MLYGALELEGSYENGNEPSGFVKDGVFRDQLSDCQLLKKHSSPWSWLDTW
jgi:hypothetical protein